ncbi:Mini-ribonuclease 3 [Leptolyngbya sp. FACHB-261]|uniref:Mini-ribonuclease 3 n=1 Tax=Leptolyngbya sp. FACHB-261 TaxID=2692806 RepID=UPI001F555BC8|nr:ribonuclease III domain-containing protein [Leptolyngbya sp. FACHB-261]
MGDAVFELYTRQILIFPPCRIQDYHRQVVAHVRAESQALSLKRLEAHLTETEQEWVRRGRNAATNAPRRLDPATYQQASGLETLIGYLYLTDPERLRQLLAVLGSE